MARTINEIQTGINTALEAGTEVKLSTSKVAEWRLWTWIVATAIQAFEVILDMYKKEVQEKTDKITPGTVRWYGEQCLRFQNGHKLLFDKNTAALYYAEDDPDSRIVKVVAIKESSKHLTIKVAKTDDSGKVMPLSPDEKYNLIAYLHEIRAAGTTTDVVSTTEDKIRYNLQVWHDTVYPYSEVEVNVKAAIEAFKTNIGFDGVIYVQQFIDAVMGAEGVVTCKLNSISRKGVSDDDFRPFDVYSDLESGYFDYAPDSTLVVESVKNMGV